MVSQSHPPPPNGNELCKNPEGGFIAIFNKCHHDEAQPFTLSEGGLSDAVRVSVSSQNTTDAAEMQRKRGRTEEASVALTERHILYYSKSLQQHPNCNKPRRIIRMIMLLSQVE